MSHEAPWTQHETTVVCVTEHLRIHRDMVTRPDGHLGHYDWLETADQVRVAALVGDEILLIDQHHYLIGRTLQLPGGNVDRSENDRQAAERELRQETGYRGGSWTRRGAVHPVPALSRARVHLWYAEHLDAGRASPEPTERDLRVVRLPLPEAVRATQDGRITCAASTALILALAEHG